MIDEVWADLYAVKDPAAVQMWAAQRPGNVVPTRWIMDKDAWQLTPHNPEGWGELLDVSRRLVVAAF